MELIIKPATDEETIEALENTIESLQQQTDQKEKKYTGYGYHGGGRKPKGEESRTCTMSIVCTAS
jgi:hypothetical protein